MPGAPRNWPHVLVEDGPSIAGISVGDAIAVVPNARIYVTDVPWDRGRSALFATSSTHDVKNGRAWRVDAGGRLERIDHEAEGPDAPWRAAPGDVVHKGPWRLRFVGDGPPLATVKRFGEHVAAHLHHTHAFAGERARSEWLLPASGARDILVVEESADGALLWFTEPRRIGVELDALRAAAHEERGEGAPPGLDRDVAAGVVAQLCEGSLSIVGFDGVVPALDGSRSRLEASPLEVYALLTRSRGLPRTTAARAKLAAELADTRAAPPAEIGQVVRALCPDAWARERALVEECGVFDVSDVSGVSDVSDVSDGGAL